VNALETIRVVDGRGKTITTAVVYEVVMVLDEMEVGELLEVFTDDFGPFDADITAWCDATGHTLEAAQSTARGRRFVIRKGDGISNTSTLAMVISPDGLEELLSPLGFALAAALEGADVSLFFQGPGVRVLTRNFHPKLRGWGRPFSRFAAAGMAKSGHVSAHEKLRQLHRLGAHIYICAPSMEHFKVRRDELMFDDVSAVEYLSFMPRMAEADAQLYV